MTTVRKWAGELERWALDYAVFMCEFGPMEPHIVTLQPKVGEIEFPKAISLSYTGAYGMEIYWRPHFDGSQAMALINKYHIDIHQCHPESAYARPAHRRVRASINSGQGKDWFGVWRRTGGYAQDVNTAVCRAVVARHYPDGIEIPAELV